MDPRDREIHPPKRPRTSEDPPLEPSPDEDAELQITTSSAGKGSDERVLVLCDECRLHSLLYRGAIISIEESRRESDRARRETSVRWRSTQAIEIRRVPTSFFFTTRGALETEPLDEAEPRTQVGREEQPTLDYIYTTKHPCSTPLVPKHRLGGYETSGTGRPSRKICKLWGGTTW